MSKQYTIEDMREYASYNGGQCLSKEYWSMDKKEKWACSKGHVWEAPFQIIRQGGWCPLCLKEHKKEERLELIKAIAEERGGECISNEYVNNTTKIQFKCNLGHIWLMRPHDILAGQWCPKCGIISRTEKRKTPIEIYYKIAEERGGKLLSDKCVNENTKLLWECSKGHQWYANGAIIIHAQSWCPYCRGMYKTIKDMQYLAAKRGGKCLSLEYVNSTTKLEWQCSKGHIWKSAPCNILDNCWCPICGIEIMKEKEKDDIEKYRKIAIERGGKLLSGVYINNITPLLWECEKGHQWKARPANVYHLNSWCPYCYGNVPKHKLRKLKIVEKNNYETFKNK